MKAVGTIIRSRKGQAVIEMVVAVPILLILGFAAVELSNALHKANVVAQTSRELVNLTSRSGTITDSQLQNFLNIVLNGAKPILCEDGVGCALNPAHWNVIYSTIVYVPALGRCGPDLPDGQPDYYHVTRLPSWTRGSLGTPSGIGNNTDCAVNRVSGISQMPSAQLLHVAEVFYDLSANRITPVQNLLTGLVLPSPLSTRSIFMDVTLGSGSAG